ncbi:MAG: protein kinase [Phycisphaerales bacterium]
MARLDSHASRLAERSRVIRAAFDAAATVPPGEWDGWLRRHVADPEIRATVIDLLRRVEPDVRADARLASAGAFPRLGTRLGTWTIVGHIGAGGMSHVYRGADDAGRAAAIKVLRKELAPRGLARRWDREVRALSTAASDDVAKLLDCGVEAIDGDSCYWLAIELIEPATNLEQYALERGLDRPARVDLLMRVARAVERAHARGIVHGDLKPSNIVIDSHGKPKILDFGLARMIGATPDSTLLWGTPAYSAPERMNPHSAPTIASDVYSLGRLAELLLRPPTGCADADSRQIARVIARATAASPADRHPTVTQFRKALAKASGAGRRDTSLTWAILGPIVVGIAACALLATQPTTRQLRVPDPRPGDILGQNLVARGDLVVASRARAASSAAFRWVDGGYVFDGLLEKPPTMSPASFGCVGAIDGERIYLGWQEAVVAEHRNAGAVLGYRRTPRGWEHCETIVASDPQSDAFFGRAISIDGDTLVVGADGHRGVAMSIAPWQWWRRATAPYLADPPTAADVEATMRGAAYVFRRANDGSWRQSQVLTRAGAIDGFQFGFAVSVRGDRLLVTNQYCAGVRDVEQGSLFVYRRDGERGRFEPRETIQRTGRASGTAFGWRIASDDSIVLVSAHAARSDARGYIGEVWVYDDVRGANGTPMLALRQVLSSKRQDDNDNFGNSIALGPDYLAIAVPGMDVHDRNDGAIQLFVASRDRLVESQLLSASQGAANDLLGGGYNNSLAASEHGVVASAWRATVDGLRDSGALYFWPIPAPPRSIDDRH